MLKLRILTALLLIPLVLVGIFYSSPIGMMIISGIIFLMAAWEWAALIGFTKTHQRIFYLQALLVFFALLFFTHHVFILITATFIWLALLYFVIRYDQFAKLWKQPGWKAALGICLLGSSWYGVNIIANLPEGRFYLLFMLLFIWGADIGAYFVGRAWGKHKLAPLISPGKSIEGVIGGSIAAVFIAAIAGYFFEPTEGLGYINLLVLALVTSLVSVLGDLTESMLKRQAGVKDSGRLLPGHGGLLDRIDSLISVAPIFALWMLLS